MTRRPLRRGDASAGARVWLVYEVRRLTYARPDGPVEVLHRRWRLGGLLVLAAGAAMAVALSLPR